MSTSIKLLSFGLLCGALVSCSGGSTDTGPTTSGGGSGSGSGSGGSGSAATGSTTGPVSEVTASVAVPASFAAQPAKIIFGYGTKQITDGNGKMLNVPNTFLPSLAGIPNPTVNAGQPYAMDMTGVTIPEGDYYVLVALYVQGTAGTIPQEGKDYIAGTTTTIHFGGAKVVLPELSFLVSKGM